jgi:predicted permease
MNALLQFYLIFYGGLALGLPLRRWQAWSPKLMRAAILGLEVPIFLYSFWILDLPKIRHYAPIPIISTLLMLILIVVSRAWSKKIFPKNPHAQGSFVLASAFSNIGTTGGAFICYLLFGTQGLSLSYLFLLPYPLVIFTLGFSLAKHYASPVRLTLTDYLHNIVSNLTSLVPLLAMSLGLILNVAKIPHWAHAPLVADVLIKTDLIIMFVAIGMTLELKALFKPWPAIAAIQVIKYLISPLLALGFIGLAYGRWNSLPAKIIFIESAMPAAIYAVITANLFQLDRKLANALWVSGTLLLIPLAAFFFLVLK